MQRTDDERIAGAQKLIAGIGTAQMRAYGIEALRRVRVAQPGQHVIQVHGEWARQLVPMLGKARGIPIVGIDAGWYAGVFPGGTNLVQQSAQPWMVPVIDFLAWLSRSGLALLLYSGDRDLQLYPTRIHLTTRGAAVVDNAGDHPLLPGFLNRLPERCPGLPDGVIALLVDARACLDNSLNRAAVVLLGVAYELAIEELIPNLTMKNFVAQNTIAQQAAERLKRIRTFVADDAKLELVVAKSDDRRAVVDAYDFAERLRQRRNDAAHTTPAFDFEHGDECEEFIVSAGRHLPALWLLST